MEVEPEAHVHFVLEFLRANAFKKAEASFLAELQERAADLDISMESKGKDTENEAYDDWFGVSSRPVEEDEVSIDGCLQSSKGVEGKPSKGALVKEEARVEEEEEGEIHEEEKEGLPSKLVREARKLTSGVQSNKDMEDEPQVEQSSSSKADSKQPTKGNLFSEAMFGLGDAHDRNGDGDLSDEYEDDEDPGYLREEVLDTASFLAGMNFDSEDEEISELHDGDKEVEELPLDTPDVEEPYPSSKPSKTSNGEPAQQSTTTSADADGESSEADSGGFLFPSLGGQEDTASAAEPFGWEGSPGSAAVKKVEGEAAATTADMFSPSGKGKQGSKRVEEEGTMAEVEEDERKAVEPVPKKESDEEEFETFDLKVIHRKGHTGFEESKDFPIRMNAVIAGRYQVMEFLGSAAFSKAVQALDLQTGMLVCIKIIKNNKDFFDQSLDEIKLLKYINRNDPEDKHNVLRLYDFFYCKEHLFIVCELLRANLYEFQKYNRESNDDAYFTMPRLQSIAKQAFKSLDYLHSLGLIHCDLKPENILIKSYSRCEVKIIDLGSSCFTTDHLSSYVQSRSYRAPEVILGAKYGQKIDVWSMGCILAELYSGLVLFQNDSLATLLARVIGILGPIPQPLLARSRLAHKYFNRQGNLYECDSVRGSVHILHPKRTTLEHRVLGADPEFVAFVRYCLTVDPDKRPSAGEALKHRWFTEVSYSA
mmetsp:Transcript_38797/g.84432  ORF Transcript_38797/g.84432 Transcript_38797/m.84432 type:complete len:707 (-) Transcript_38797:296-2416(-)|eukprot:CAMPEP_0118935286 /NCGR_PEP_ID=MMETSP1169-20130426/15352_1 /TAXON_ID=36882 /ORGANISM="Pyramimonas obovata, Strain CCMP722" /LENGTH=706 /DNA_ID=CAMNT_0006878301 /DNA_START=315 /DNA_END=2435 /DNA_ORIENTATION=+